jgi:hypothetical protein
MVLAKLLAEDFGYRLLYLLHIVTVIVAFGATFAYPAYARRGRQLPPAEGYAISTATLGVARELTTYGTWVAALFGTILVAASEQWKFSQTWVSIAFVLFFIGAALSIFVHMPNLKRMNALQEQLVAGGGTANPAGGPPAEVAELQQRGKRAGMVGGILHLLFLLMVIDMIWKPGL